jgi:hypothetical protein
MTSLALRTGSSSPMQIRTGTQDAIARHAGVTVADGLGEEGVLDGPGGALACLCRAEAFNRFDELSDGGLAAAVAVVVVRMVERGRGIGEDETGEAFGPGDGKLERDHAAEAGASERADVDLQVVEEGRDIAGEGLDGVGLGLLGRGGLAVATQVERDRPVIGGQVFEEGSPAAEV